MAGTAEGNHFLKERIWQERQRKISLCGKGMMGAAGRFIFCGKDMMGAEKEGSIYE